MKKVITTMFCTAVLCGVSANESVLRNGDFEIVEKRAKATSKHLMGQIKQGWNIGNNGPVLELPKWWLVNNGKGTLRIITAGENGENKENVKNGKILFILNPEAVNLCVLLRNSNLANIF